MEPVSEARERTEKTERIGKVTLDLSLYCGEDLYCDGPVEERLLQITRDLSPVEYREQIEQSGNWPILYHLSPLRENIVEWLPMTEGDKVLEVGSGCGAITGALARKAGEVTCVDLSLQRSRINAYRHSDAENVTIHVGNFKEIEPTLGADYTWICLIGVFEYGAAYIGGKTPYEDFLKILKKHLAPDGHIVIAIENRFGLKYFAGCREDHLGTFFTGIEDYPGQSGIRTFTRDGLLGIAERCGIPREDCHFYYPYPDYKFMHTLFSDKRLPKIGECKDNKRNFDRDRMMLFDEKQVFDSLVREGQFPLFSNSHLLLIGPDTEIKYARYSNDRDDSACICTEIHEFCGELEGEEVHEDYIVKRPLSKASEAHLLRMKESYDLLCNRYDGSGLQIAECEVSKTEPVSVAFPFAQGVSLEELLDGLLAQGDIPGFQDLFREYVRRISYGEEKAVTDYDLIFSNILVDGDTWTVIDYEWTFPERKDSRQIAFRALYCYLLEDEAREACEPDTLLSEMGITPENAEEYRRDEMAFQKRVTKGHLALGELRERIGNACYPVDALVSGAAKLTGGSDRLQVYEDRGGGFSEETSYFPEALPDTEGEYGASGRYELSVDGACRAVRIDPGSRRCLVVVQNLSWNGKPIPEKMLTPVQGCALGDGIYLFDSEDPQLLLSFEKLQKLPGNVLELELAVSEVNPEAARAGAKSGAKKKGLFGLGG